jgi:nucleoid-associated protein YgaU
MQQIERYGVIALVFLLVTIVAVSFWGDNKSPGFWSRLTGRDAKKTEIAKNAAAPEHPLDTALPLNTNPIAPPIEPQAPPQQQPIVAATQPQAGAPAPSPAPSNALVNANASNAPGAAHPMNNAPPQTSLPQSSAPAFAALPPQSAPAAKAQATELPSSTKDAHKSAKSAAPSGPSVEYVVQKGDSLASIAQKNLGSSSRWTEIQSMNGGIQPKSLRVGTKLKLPTATTVKSTIEKSAPKAEASSPARHSAPSSETASHPGTVYVVKAGETLRSIAEKKLGNADRWKDIVAANPGLDPHKIAVGKTLKLPTGETREIHEPRDSHALVAAALPSDSHASGKPHVR